MNRFFMSTRPSASPSGGMSTSSVNDVTILPNAAPRMTAMARSSTFPRMTNALNSLSIGSGVRDEMEAGGRACGGPPPLARGDPSPGSRLTEPPSPDYLQTTMATTDTDILSREELVAQLQDEIKALARRKNAVILAHNYERAEVQDVADYVGDSLGLSREAAKTDADVIVFCGVHFMAETAAVLSPNKKVLLPDLAAGCSLASTIDAEQLRAWKAEHPGAVVVSYVNTTAEVKAESDYCCTSGNAVEVVYAVTADTEILFCPDMFLGAHVKRMSGRENIRVWLGECHVHAGIDPENIRLQRSLHPEAEVLIHPECGCSTSVLEAMSAGDVDPEGVQILSTEGMIKRPALSDADEFIVATEVGILHRLRRENPSKRFFAANEKAACTYMKVTTLPKVKRALERLEHRITVPPHVAERARLAIERMIAIGGQHPLSPVPQSTIDPGE